jgi:predicted dehydrogenase
MGRRAQAEGLCYGEKKQLSKVRMAVVGAGAFGRNHLRVIAQSERAELTAVVDADPGRAAAAGAEFGCAGASDYREIAGRVDAAVIATPTSSHGDIGCALLAEGIDLLVEKPIAHNIESARGLTDTAGAHGRILQVGHLERFNPAVLGLRKVVTLPLFFEIHRLNLFSPRSLDVDVVLDLMIHDIDLVLDLVGQMPEEIRAAGISILSPKVDIANVRLAFAGGCIANLTASRVSTERVRKMRLFQPRQYVSIDYTRQDGVVFTVSGGQQIGFVPLVVQKDEPLRLQLESFLDAVQMRTPPMASGEGATRSLQVALAILDKIEEHSQLVRRATGVDSATSPL